MYYYKIRAGMYAAHREDPSKGNPRPDVSQVGYIQREGKLWTAYTPNGIEIAGGPWSTQEEAQEALEGFAKFTVFRASVVSK